MFALDPQDFAARRHDGSGRTQTYDRFRQSGRRVDDMFAIIENQEKLLSSDSAGDRLPGNLLAAQPQAQHARDHRRDQTGIRQGNHINEPTVAVKGREQVAGNLERQRRFSNPAGSSQRDLSVGAEKFLQLPHGSGSADDLRCRRG
ncbi:MAG: hypothetical protein JWM63_2474 [Gammaproteobacteria bacterium]|nr:hypothetical protein [Gammaproteobacteria bacterium]